MTKLQWQPQLKTMAEATEILTKKYLNLKHEQAYIQFPDNKIARVQGGPHRINLGTDHIDLTLRNCHLLHNHPTSIFSFFENEPRGLSGWDVAFAIQANLRSIAVLENYHGVQLTRPTDGWPSIGTTVFKMYNHPDWDHAGVLKVWKTHEPSIS